MGVTFAPTAIIWGGLIGLAAGAATDSLAVGIIVWIVVSAAGWYVIRLGEGMIERSILAGMEALAKWIEARKPGDVRMQALRDRTARFLRSEIDKYQSGGESRPPAGWYPDPSGAPGEQYWDGQSWTEKFRPA